MIWREKIKLGLEMLSLFRYRDGEKWLRGHVCHQMKWKEEI